MESKCHHEDGILLWLLENPYQQNLSHLLKSLLLVKYLQQLK